MDRKRPVGSRVCCRLRRAKRDALCSTTRAGGGFRERTSNRAIVLHSTLIFSDKLTVDPVVRARKLSNSSRSGREHLPTYKFVRVFLSLHKDYDEIFITVGRNGRDAGSYRL